MKKESMTTDDFVKTQVLPEFHPVEEMLRALKREIVPDVNEEIRYGIPAYKRRQIVRDHLYFPSRQNIQTQA